MYITLSRTTVVVICVLVYYVLAAGYRATPTCRPLQFSGFFNFTDTAARVQLTSEKLDMTMHVKTSKIRLRSNLDLDTSKLSKK